MNLTLWHDIMYCVGVFVTCNVGGAALRLARDGAVALAKRHAGVFDGNAADEQDAAREWNSQSFDDIQRELGRGETARKSDKGADT